MSSTRQKFAKGFYWGAASSGPQSEGSKNKVNKSIWDHWYEIDNKAFFENVGPEKTTNVYEKYEEDIKLMKEIGLNSFRTSIQWSRLIKNFDTLEADEDGYRFYREYFTKLKANGIEPFVNLFHFDMPLALQERGGWENKEVVGLFAKYADKAFELYGDIVDNWFTHNEPIVPALAGYLEQAHYPLILKQEKE